MESDEITRIFPLLIDRRMGGIRAHVIRPYCSALPRRRQTFVGLSYRNFRTNPPMQWTRPPFSTLSCRSLPC